MLQRCPLLFRASLVPLYVCVNGSGKMEPYSRSLFSSKLESKVEILVRLHSVLVYCDADGYIYAIRLSVTILVSVLNFTL